MDDGLDCLLVAVRSSPYSGGGSKEPRRKTRFVYGCLFIGSCLGPPVFPTILARKLTTPILPSGVLIDEDPPYQPTKLPPLQKLCFPGRTD
jgi:hypothetical protein